MRVTVLFMILLIAVLITPLASEAQPGGGPGFRGSDSYEGIPYGRSCPGPRWGRPYGQRKVVKTAEEAKQAIEKYFSDSGQTVQVVKIEGKRGGYFEADIANPDGVLIDKLIIDKRSGRIRSIY